VIIYIYKGKTVQAVELQSTLQLAAEVLKFLEASATKLQLELSCRSLRCENHFFYTWSLVSVRFSFPLCFASLNLRFLLS